MGTQPVVSLFQCDPMMNKSLGVFNGMLEYRLKGGAGHLWIVKVHLFLVKA